MTAQGKGTKKFSFDFAFWSFDNSRERATQDTIYNDLGLTVPSLPMDSQDLVRVTQ